MVHALKEAHRVLKPNGLLIDLRPAPAHRRLGLGEGRRWRETGPLHEVLDDDFAADAAVEKMIRNGYLGVERRARFQLDRVMDSMDEARDFMEDFDQRRDIPSHAALLDELEQQRAQLAKPDRITVRGPMKLVVLRKLEPPVEADKRGDTMILAIVPDASRVEALLNNLSEADFSLKDVSVIMQDIATRNQIAKDTGPLRGAKPAQLSGALKQAGISDASAQRLMDAVKSGKAIIVMKADPKYEQAAREMFTDMSAEVLED
jgi:hypothetical protein